MRLYRQITLMLVLLFPALAKAQVSGDFTVDVEAYNKKSGRPLQALASFYINLPGRPPWEADSIRMRVDSSL